MPMNRKFLPLYASKDRYFILTGGRGSGKSFANSEFILRLTFERGHVILFTRYTLTSASISIIPEFVEKMELLGLTSKFDVTKDVITNVMTGSKIIFRGIKTSTGNQTANLKSIQGVTTWVLDEAEELVDEKIFDKIDDSIRTKNIQNRVILILNPTTHHHWIYKRFFEQGNYPNTTYIHTTYLDNIENISESFTSKAQRVKDANEELYKHRYLGAWLDRAEGVVFSNWSIGDFDNSLQVIFGQDYGFSNDPTTLVKVAIDEHKKKLYLHECYSKQGLSTNQIHELNKAYALNGVIIGDSAEPRLIDELKKLGLNIKPAEKGQGSVSAGLLAMQDYEIIVTPESHNLQKEMRNYVWLDSGSKLVIDDFNHCIDAGRYAFQFVTQGKHRKYHF
jgi:phage terminase large subunit